MVETWIGANHAEISIMVCTPPAHILLYTLQALDADERFVIRAPEMGHDARMPLRVIEN